MYEAWSFKHKPKTLSEIVGNSEAKEKLCEWAKSWEKGVPKKRAVLLYGPPGIGKTITVEALSKDLHFEFVEKNASDYRTEDAVKSFAGLASQYASLFGGKRIILMDELDGLTGTSDRGGVKALIEVIKTAQSPVILISNSAYDPRFANLRTYCLLIEFKKPAISEVTKHLKHICSEEGIQADENALGFIAQRSEGDIRSAVNDLQALAQGKKKLTYDDVSWLGYRDRQDSIFNVLKMILYGKTAASAKQAANMTDVDTDMLFEWIYENVPEHLNDPRDLSQAMDALSLADVYRGRIRSSQDWSFTRYVVDFMTAGVAMSRHNSKITGWTPFKFPSRISMLSRSKMERAMQLSIGRKIKRRCHISAVRASKEILPYLQMIFCNNTVMAAGLSKWLDLDSEMVQYLAGTEKKTAEIAKFIE